jgi:Mlc titration factor MtfA (ptsG expression regulator)
MPVIIAIVVLLLIGFLIFKMNPKKERDWISPNDSFPESWKAILQDKVLYYRALTPDEQKRFEYKVHEFLLNCTISGVRTEITDLDRILVASSAIIPIFSFDNWKYYSLKEVLIYPTMFNDKFETDGKDRKIMGMVGNAYMDGHMVLSQQSLRHGFENETDKKNTAVHEFVHIIDKKDGKIDGVPEILMNRQYVIPWMEFMNKKMDEIYEGESDINPYGGTNQAEFFSVASEYFFERPKLLKKKHPELYDHLEKLFRQDMSQKKLKK